MSVMDIRPKLDSVLEAMQLQVSSIDKGERRSTLEDKTARDKDYSHSIKQEQKIDHDLPLDYSLHKKVHEKNAVEERVDDCLVEILKMFGRDFEPEF